MRKANAHRGKRTAAHLRPAPPRRRRGMAVVLGAVVLIAALAGVAFALGGGAVGGGAPEPEAAGSARAPAAQGSSRRVAARDTTADKAESAADADAPRTDEAPTAPSPAPSPQQQLDAAVAALETAGYQVGYDVVDLATGRELAHNADATFYSASAIKAPFCVSLLEAQGAAAQAKWGSLIEATLRNSDNEAYRTLRKQLYPAPFFGAFAREAGMDIDLVHWYVDISPRQLAALWRVMVPWLSSGDATATWAAGLLTDTLNSQLDDVAGADGAVTTWSKAGWYAGEGLDVTADAGAVCAQGGTYVVAVMTNTGADFDALKRVLEPLIAVWEAGGPAA